MDVGTGDTVLYANRQISGALAWLQARTGSRRGKLATVAAALAIGLATPPEVGLIVRRDANGSWSDDNGGEHPDPGDEARRAHGEKKRRERHPGQAEHVLQGRPPELHDAALGFLETEARAMLPAAGEATRHAGGNRDAHERPRNT